LSSYKNIHRHFRINGLHLAKSDLYVLAHDFTKNGNSHQKSIGIFISNWLDGKATITLQTSGTTGKPKQICVSKQAMVDSALATGYFFGLKPKNKALCCLPLDFIAGKMMLIRAFTLGLDLDIVEPNSKPLQNIQKKYDFVAMTPMQAQNSIEKLHRIKKLILGGSKVSKSLEEQLKKIQTKIYETYASTETLTHIAARKIGEKSFKLLPNISISLNQRDCLVIDAPRISNQKIITNDLVKIISKNEFVWLGRIDNVINSGGVKLFPEKMEDRLADKIPHRFFLGGISDSILGEKLVLIIEYEKYKLPENIFDDLEKYEKPKEIFFVPKFIQTENGKIKRKEIFFTHQKFNTSQKLRLFI